MSNDQKVAVAIRAASIYNVGQGQIPMGDAIQAAVLLQRLDKEKPTLSKIMEKHKPVTRWMRENGHGEFVSHSKLMAYRDATMPQISKDLSKDDQTIELFRRWSEHVRTYAVSKGYKPK
jgi:hypothetical protein